MRACDVVCVPYSTILENEIDEALLNILNEKFLYHLLNKELKGTRKPLISPRLQKDLQQVVKINYRPRVGLLDALTS